MFSSDPVLAYIALGANLGDAEGMLRQALDQIAALPSTTVDKCSSFYRTAPVDATGPDYINAVAAISTLQSAPVLLQMLQAIEQGAGRERPYRNAPRTLDLDVLLYGSARIQSAALTVPHPRMADRGFVLLPLAEIAPELVPVAWLDAVRDQAVQRL
jgi:2-amino-4-hydroxy-6-hydroxymethyldihydropteridine diphosphokinase